MESLMYVNVDQCRCLQLSWPLHSKSIMHTVS